MARNALEQHQPDVAAKISDLRRHRNEAAQTEAEGDYEASLHALEHARMHAEDGIELSFDSVRISESSLSATR